MCTLPCPCLWQVCPPTVPATQVGSFYAFMKFITQVQSLKMVSVFPVVWLVSINYIHPASISSECGLARICVVSVWTYFDPQQRQQQQQQTKNMTLHFPWNWLFCLCKLHDAVNIDEHSIYDDLWIVMNWYISWYISLDGPFSSLMCLVNVPWTASPPMSVSTPVATAGPRSRGCSSSLLSETCMHCPETEMSHWYQQSHLESLNEVKISACRRSNQLLPA